MAQGLDKFVLPLFVTSAGPFRCASRELSFLSILASWERVIAKITERSTPIIVLKIAINASVRVTLGSNIA
jgi:hypothetical protein